MWNPIKNYVSSRLLDTLKAVPLEKVAAVITKVEGQHEELSAEAVSRAELSAAKQRRAVTLLLNLIDIPYVPEWAERMLYAMLVDAMVKVFNQYIWKKDKKAKKE